MRPHKGNGNPNHPHHGKYHGCDRRAVRCWIWMHDRCRHMGRKCAWPRTREGYDAFYAEMGPIPKGMKRASVGRIDHDKGYEPGNVRWEPFSYNRWKTRRNEVENGVPLMASAGVVAPKKWTQDGEDWDLG